MEYEDISRWWTENECVSSGGRAHTESDGRVVCLFPTAQGSNKPSLFDSKYLLYLAGGVVILYIFSSLVRK